MQQNHIAFPSIRQYKEIVRQVREQCKYYDIDLPKLGFMGSVKIHGTNAAICRPVKGSLDDIYAQSRERIITVDNDNFGFAMWVEANKEVINRLFDYISIGEQFRENQIIQIYGEWFGGNIQKGVGVSNLKKSFAVFDIRVSVDAESTNWYSCSEVIQAIDTVKFTIPNFYTIYRFPTWYVEIDFNEPEKVQNSLVDLTNAVENECPVAAKLLPKPYPECMTGEGIVWHCVTKHDVIDTSSLVFKVKGEETSFS